mgnify:CR=1 FL=1
MKTKYNLLTEFKETIEKYSPSHYSAILAVPVGLFILGFLIWNSYLYSFGFLGDEFLKGKFILAGVWFVIVSFFLLSVFLFVGSLINFIFAVLNSFLSPFLHFKRIGHLIQKNKAIQTSFQFVTEIKNNFLSTLFLLLILIWFFFYTIYLFPIFPAFVGGGQPRSISLITDKDSLPTLQSLGIPLADGGTFQTENL